MVNVLIPGLSGSNSGQGHCIVFLLMGKTLNPHSASQPRSINDYWHIVGET